MEKLEFMHLWDLYRALLTDTQQEITGMYFNLDLTVSEIAEEKGVSRQSVSECLSLCKRELAAYEEKLGHGKMLAAADIRTTCALKKAGRWADDFVTSHPEYVADIGKLKDILSDDYGAEIAERLNKSGK